MWLLGRDISSCYWSARTKDLQNHFCQQWINLNPYFACWLLLMAENIWASICRCHLQFHLHFFYSKGQKMDEKKGNIEHWVQVLLNRAFTYWYLSGVLYIGFFTTYEQRSIYTWHQYHLSDGVKHTLKGLQWVDVFLHKRFPSYEEHLESFTFKPNVRW